MRTAAWAASFLVVSCILGVAIASESPADREARPLWQIGEADGRTADLAFGPKGYAKFSGDPVFFVGRSVPRKDWPYAHPGPADAWAGSRPHTFTAIFEIESLPPRMEGNAELRLLLCDTQQKAPPGLEVSLNGQLQTAQTQPGSGDATIKSGAAGRADRLSFHFPLSLLRKGTNVLEIRNVKGSWLLYDAVQCFAPAGIKLARPASYTVIERVEDTVLLRQAAGRPTQLVRVEVLTTAAEPASATLRATLASGGKPITLPVSIRRRRQTFELDVPRVEGAPTSLAVTLVMGRTEVSTAAASLRVHRPWTVYLVPHSHVDIGFTDVQTNVLEQQKKFINDAMDFVEQHPEFTGDARFCWNVEVLWAVKDLLRHADAAQRDRFLRHVRNGTIGLDALYANELTGLCTSEEMVRLVSYAGDLVREHGLTIDSAMISDVPGCSWGLAAVLGDVGVRYFDVGPNRGDRIGSVRRVWRDKPFYWETSDQRRRVLVWLTPISYARTFNLLQTDAGVGELLAYLNGLEANPEYPYDVFRVRVCARDNGAPQFHLPPLVRDWNAKYDSPHLVIGRSRDPFVALQKKFGDRLPVYRGDFSPYWEDGAASSADETARNRRAAKSLEAAETIWSLARVAHGNRELRPPTPQLERAWDNVLLYDEHTWGDHNAIREPETSPVLAQWAIKGAFAREAEAQSAALVQEGLAALARQIPTGADPAIVVFNPCSWERTDLATVEWPRGGETMIADSSGQPVEYVRSADGRRAGFLARKVPALGYRTYRFAAAGKGARPSPPVPAADRLKGILESPFFGVRLDAKNASASRVELPRRGSRPARLLSAGRFGQFLYCREGVTTQVTAAANADLVPATANSPDGGAWALRSKAPGCRSLLQTFETHRDCAWLISSIHWTATMFGNPRGCISISLLRG